MGRAGNTRGSGKRTPLCGPAHDESKWLGWLDIVDQQLAQCFQIQSLAAEIHEDGFTHILLLGMGGSSLCPEVFSLTFGKQADSPELLVLDSTDPVQIESFRDEDRSRAHAVLRFEQVRHNARAEHLHAVLLRRDEEGSGRSRGPSFHRGHRSRFEAREA